MHEGHRKRLRENFLKNGLDNFQSHNVLEMLLFYTIPRGDTNETAHRLIDRFGSLSAVLEAPVEELMKVKGVGERTAAFLHLVPEITRVYLKDKQENVKILDTPEKVAAYILPYFVGKTKENIVVLCLDNKCAVKNCSIMAEGSVSMGDINNRNLIELVIRSNATSVVIAHNHPNGVPAPSKEDVETTFMLASLFKSIDVVLSDHIIVAGGEWCSMASSAKFAPIFN